MNGHGHALARVDAPKAAPPSRPAARPAPRLEAESGGGLRVLTYLRLHWLMILFCGTLLGTGLAFAAWEMLPSKYESYALLQVSSTPSYIASQGNREQARTDFVTYLKTTAALIKSEFVLNSALREMRDLATIRDQREPIKYLDEEILINWQEGSEVVRITFKGHAPADVKKVVDSVQGAFMKEVVEKELKLKQAFLEQIRKERDDVRTFLDNKARSAQKGTALAAAPAPAPVVGLAPPGPLPQLAPVGPAAAPPPAGPVVPVAAVQPADALAVRLNPQMLISRISTLQTEVERLPISINDARRRMEVVKARRELLKGGPAEPGSMVVVEKDPDVAMAQMKLDRARKEYEFFKNSSSNPNAPRVLELKAAYEAQQKALDKVRQDKLIAVEGVRRLDEAKRLAADEIEADRMLRMLSEQYDIAKAQLAKAEKQLADLPPEVKLDPTDKSGPGYDPAVAALETEDGLYRKLVQQDLMTKMELVSPARVRLLQPASSPTQRDTKKQVLVTVFAGLMGYALIALGAVGFETVTRRVSSLADLKGGTPAPVVGVIPCEPGDAIGRDPAKRAAANEAVDKLRAYVAQTWLSRGAATVAVTSPVGDEGKAFTAFGLASSLAQAGYRTLLVDFDLRDPSLHSYGGVPNAAGVCEVLRGDADVRQATQQLPSGLHLLPAGKWSDEARKAAVGGRLEALVSKLREPYDCVVLHGHAILTAAESVEVARRCEAVLVCARYRETKLPLLKRATDRVAAMEIPYSGVVYVGSTEHEALC